MRACYLPLLNVLQITVTWGKGGMGCLQLVAARFS